MNWIYLNNEDNSARFILGEYSNELARTLICFGVNPSTAEPNALDRTLEKVRTLARRNGYVNWIMLNLYPQRATQPTDLHEDKDAELCRRNFDAIKNTFQDFTNADILLAFGNLILIRPYLKACYNQIQEFLTANFSGKIYCIKLTKLGFPVHPLYQKNDSIFEEYHLQEITA